MSAFDHEGLLTLARRAHLAAEDADVERLADDLDTLVRALSDHLTDEALLFTRLPPAEVRLLYRGQVRVSATARALRREVMHGCGGPAPRCAARAEDLLALLTLQVHDERLALQGLPIGRTAIPWWWR